MNTHAETARQMLIKHIENLQEVVNRSKSFHDELKEKVTGPDSHPDELMKFDSYWHPGSKHFENKEIARPTIFLREIRDLLNFQHQAIGAFSDDQLAAFFLGLGFLDLDLKFWGFEQTQRNINRAEKALNFYDGVLDRMSEEESREFSKYVPSEIEFLPSKNADPRPYLKQRIELYKIQLELLSSILVISDEIE